MLQRVEYALKSDSVDRVSEQMRSFLTKAGTDHEIVIQNCLFAEEILLAWIGADISDSFSLTMGYRYKKPVVILEAEGVPFNAFEKKDDDNFFLLRNLLNSLGRYPVYSYINGKNTIHFNFPAEKKNKLAQIVIAIISAVLVGLIFRLLLSPEIAQIVLDDVINPLYTTAFKVLGFISGPLILLSVTWGIYGIGDSSTLNLVGRKMIFRFLAIIFAIALVASMSFIFFHFDINSVSGSSSSFKSIFEMILDIIPPDIIEPFSSGNTLHIIFVAVIVGIAMLYLGKRVSTVADLVQEINCIVQFLMTFISSLMPYFVFLIVLRIILNNSLSVVSSVWRLLLSFIVAVFALCFIFTMVVSIKHKVSPLTILKKSATTVLIAITTASSAAAFSSNMETCEKKFGIDKSLCAFGIPLGMVMFKTSTTAYYVLVSFFFAKQFNIAVSPDWLVSVMFVSAVLAIATPPIPGGGVIAYTMLFAKLGIPDEALAIVISIDILFDFIRTAANMYNLPLALINVSSTMGRLDSDILRNKDLN